LSAQALADYGCPYSEEFTSPQEKRMFVKGRKCSITGRACWNWNKMDAVMSCKVKKAFGAKKE